MDLLFNSLLVAVLWAVGGILKKVVITQISPEIAMILIGLAYAIIVIIFGATKFKDTVAVVKSLKASEWAVIGFIALVSVFAANLILYRLLESNEVYRVTALTYVSPLITLFLAALFLKEEVTMLSFVGVLLTMVGIVLVSYR